MSDIPELGWITDGRVSRVIDGDTIEVEVTRKFVVRLKNCWAPETDKAGEKTRGMASKKAMEKLCDGMQVRMQIAGSEHANFRDVTTLGRVLGNVYLLKDGTDIGAAQVAAGHATKTKK